MAKATHQTPRLDVKELTEIVNVGQSIAEDFRRIGISKPQQLTGKDPVKLYQSLAKTDGHFHDPCVLDVIMSAIDFMNGNPPQKWWSFTKERKAKHTVVVDKLRAYYSS